MAKGVSDGILKTFPMSDIIMKELTGTDQSQMLDKLERLNQIDELLRQSDECDLGSARKLLKSSPKQFSALVDELIAHKLGEFYFLNQVDVVGHSEAGFVVLLRNMQTIDCRLMGRIAAGIAHGDTTLPNGWERFLNFGHDPISMITGVLRSPDIEHLAQHFSSLFTRIGLEDQPAETYEAHRTLCNRL